MLFILFLHQYGLVWQSIPSQSINACIHTTTCIKGWKNIVEPQVVYDLASCLVRSFNEDTLIVLTLKFLSVYWSNFKIKYQLGENRFNELKFFKLKWSSIMVNLHINCRINQSITVLMLNDRVSDILVIKFHFGGYGCPVSLQDKYRGGKPSCCR